MSKYPLAWKVINTDPYCDYEYTYVISSNHQSAKRKAEWELESEYDYLDVVRAPYLD